MGSWDQLTGHTSVRAKEFVLDGDYHKDTKSTKQADSGIPLEIFESSWLNSRAKPCQGLTACGASLAPFRARCRLFLEFRACRAVFFRGRGRSAPWRCRGG